MKLWKLHVQIQGKNHFDEFLMSLLDKKFFFRCTLNVAFSYTSREEVCSAVKKVSKAVEEGLLKPKDIDQNLIEKCLYTGCSPMPDLLVRTSGEVRLSDFLLWQSAYSVTYFSEVLWPEFSLNNLLMAIFYYQRHQRYVNSLISIEKPEHSFQQQERICNFLSTLDLWLLPN